MVRSQDTLARLNQSDQSDQSDPSGETAFVVLYTAHWRHRSLEIIPEAVYTDSEMAYSHALTRALEDGCACLDDDGTQRLAQIARTIAADVRFQESWRQVDEFLQGEKTRLDWDVWPRCWVQATQLRSWRQLRGGPRIVIEELEYLFSDEAARDSGSENEVGDKADRRDEMREESERGDEMCDEVMNNKDDGNEVAQVDEKEVREEDEGDNEVREEEAEEDEMRDKNDGVQEEEDQDRDEDDDEEYEMGDEDGEGNDEDDDEILAGASDGD